MQMIKKRETLQRIRINVLKIWNDLNVFHSLRPGASVIDFIDHLVIRKGTGRLYNVFCPYVMIVFYMKRYFKRMGTRNEESKSHFI